LKVLVGGIGTTSSGLGDVPSNGTAVVRRALAALFATPALLAVFARETFFRATVLALFAMIIPLMSVPQTLTRRLNPRRRPRDQMMLKQLTPCTCNHPDAQFESQIIPGYGQRLATTPRTGRAACK